MPLSALHLPSLSITGFRGIESLRLPRLGRVTLLTGQNSVGKTTVLDAVRLYAARGDANVLLELLDGREEVVTGLDEDGDTIVYPDFASLFTESGAGGPEPIKIRANGGTHNLGMVLTQPDEKGNKGFLPAVDEPARLLNVTVGRRKRTLYPLPFAYIDRGGGGRFPLRARYTSRPSSASPWPKPIQCQSLGPGLLGNAAFGLLWDSVALTQGEELAVEALRMVTGINLERLMVIGGGSRSGFSEGRRAVAKLKSYSHPVPLKRLGDGATRLFGMALALANSRNGFLLIDEAENGIHYSIQSDVWRMVLRAAEAGNVQVIATTHSSDCIRGFARAAIESPADGVLYRLQHVDDILEAVEYSEDDLNVAARQNIEVR